ncbi:hypothetical protein Tco_0246545 [Tanacetum coccineum]
MKSLEGLVTRIRCKAVVLVEENKILTREIVSTMKPWVEIIREDVFYLGGNQDHVLACLCYMLYCVAKSEKINLAFFIAKRMEFVTKQARLIRSYDTSSTFGTTSSSFESKPQSSSPSSNDTQSPQPLNPFLNDNMDAPPIPSNLIPLQGHPSLDITLSFSPITPLDHILDTPSPPSPQPPPQPPLMGHPIYFNYHDFNGSTCLCCFHSRNLFFTLRDEMNLMFAHLEYLLTSAIASPSPPHP